MSDRIRRVYVAATPAPGTRATLDPDESHHVARVLRLRRGDAVEAFDGKGGAWDGTIEEASGAGVTIAIGRAKDDEVEPILRVVVHQAIARPEKLEWVLQKGTELGVAAFRLIATERVEAPAPSPSRLTRYARIILEACKQSGRRRLPELTWGAFQAPRPGGTAILLTPDVAAPPLGSMLDAEATPEVHLAVGPEGGFSEAELDAARAAGWRLASLGPRVLRTETAGCVAAAIVLHRWADLGRRPGP